jgi:uncharacterized protein (DUF1800 family)
MTCRVALLAIFAMSAIGSARADVGTAIEFYAPALRHYFITASPQEAAALDAGNPVAGWVRTGGEFSVFTDPGPGRLEVCRFFGLLGGGLSTHFYTADPVECAKVKTLQPVWTYEGIAFYIQTPTNGSCGGNWPVYRSYYSDNISDFNHRFTVDLTAHVRMAARRGDILEGVVMCAPITDAELEADVVRFLEQATLGPSDALVQEVKATGIAAWIDQQTPMNVTRYTQPGYYEPPMNDRSLCKDDPTPPITPEKFCFTNKLTHGPVGWEFFRQSRTAPDQLRLRMAHVWHQIFVASLMDLTYEAAEFEQRLRDGALGTFENLLASYALSPQLGTFQNWVNNVPEHDGIRPNENFARELMQLMTIGVNQLNEDGTQMLDSAGQLVPTYGQADIMTVARVLTGYTYPTLPGQTPNFPANVQYFIGDMIPFDAFHDQGSKVALNGLLNLGPGGGATAEVRTLLKTLVDHPNTPPFISKQLIQKMVTSDPTPGYVARVAAVFKDNGAGVRGDLAAVTRAILLDPEARGARKIDPEYGRLREPVLFWTAMIRGLDVPTDGLVPHQMVGLSLQDLFRPFSVFNYYPADFTLSGTSLPAPEFGIFTSSEFINRANQVNQLIYFGWGPEGFVPNAVGTPTPLFTTFLSDAGNADALVERMNRLLLHGTMKPDMRQTIVNAVNKLPPVQLMLRIKLAANLTLISIDYQVQK